VLLLLELFAGALGNIERLRRHLARLPRDVERVLFECFKVRRRAVG
jgi:hypothetical protein